jgi:cysteine synthase
VVDGWEKTRDKEALTMSRRLIKEEGLLCGKSNISLKTNLFKSIEVERVNN